MTLYATWRMIPPVKDNDRETGDGTMARRSKVKPVALTPAQEIERDFSVVVNMTDADATSLYWFGEADFDPQAALDNAASNLVAQYVRLTGLDRDSAVSALHEADGRIRLEAYEANLKVKV